MNRARGKVLLLSFALPLSDLNYSISQFRVLTKRHGEASPRKYHRYIKKVQRIGH